MRNTYLWLLQLITGALILVLLGIHLITQHPAGLVILNQKFEAILGIVADNGERTTNAIANVKQSFSVSLYIVLLVAVVYHGISGLRGIILEIAPRKKTEHIVTYSLIAFGIVTVVILVLSRFLLQ